MEPAGPVSSFFEHLEELRRRLFIALGAVLAGAGFGYFFSDRALTYLLRPIRTEIGQAYFFSPAEALVVKLKVALLLGVLAAAPVLFWQFWQFISPALFRNEKQFFLGLVVVTSALFLAGAFFCFYGVLPVALRFLVGMQSDVLQPMISITEYLSFLAGMSVAFGIAFNLPVVILGLVKAGVLNSRMLGHYQRHAIVLIFIAAAVLTPGPDIASQLLLAAPLLVLFEGSVLLAGIFEKKTP